MKGKTVRGPKLTKAEIIESIHERVKLNKKDIHVIIDEFCEEIKKGLVAFRDVELRGFGTFEVRIRKGRHNARNPKTGKTAPVEDHGVAAFRAGRELKQNVWPLSDDDARA